MSLIGLLMGCISESKNDGFGIVSSVADQSLDTSDKENEEQLDTSDENVDDDLENPFSVDSSLVCGTRNIGTSVGDCAVNFTLINREFEQVELHSFVGSVIFLDLSGFG